MPAKKTAAARAAGAASIVIDDNHSLGGSKTLFDAIYEDLLRLGVERPKKDAKDIAKGELGAILQAEIDRRIREEVTNDPAGMGYEGKTDEQILALINGPILETVPIINIDEQTGQQIGETIYITRDSGKAPRIHDILVGVPYGPNVITVADLQAAMAGG